MAKHVLILGAGLVSQPIIDYLFEHTDYSLTVADIQAENAAKAVKGNDRGTAAALDVQNKEGLQGLIQGADLVVSLLPYTLHALVAEHCLKLGKHMVNASYVSEEMRALDAAAREKGLLFLCEIGLDPGLDHMSAMRIIHEAQQQGAHISAFVSVCGGLPAPDANTNPFGYKFSWSPKGVLLAGNNAARYIQNGSTKEISADRLFHSTRPMTINGQEFEAYPNRDSTPYKALYGLEGIDLLMRGTLRYEGWHDLILGFKDLGLLTEHHIPAGTTSWADLIADLNGLDVKNIKSEVVSKLQLAVPNRVLDAFDWLGIFSDEQFDTPETTMLDVLAMRMNQAMSYAAGERDMVVLQHQFTIEYADRIDTLHSTLVDYGIPHGASSMARTVSLPLAIAVRLILEGKIDLRGVQIPVDPSIYNPVLDELVGLNIEFKEETVRSVSKN